MLRVFGSDYEEYRQEHLSGDARRILRYRGERRVPHRSWRVGKLSRVDHWDMETYEVDVEIQNDRVADVQARVRRARWEPASPN